MKITAGLALIISFLTAIPATAGTSLAFPGARGFGVETPAGRGGKIIRVTSLESEGPGSLREALKTKGPRIVVFEVGGVIDLKKRALVVEEPFLTVAGQTAPSPGITIIRGPMYIKTHDVLIRHIRVRPGDAGEARKSGWEPDGISTSGGDAYNIVIDHCSVTWAVDENLSASGPRYEGPKATSRNITFSNCIIAEALDDTSHRKGPHSKGTLIHDFCTNIAIIGNLYAHNYDRNPRFKGGCTGVVVNNLIYNPADSILRSGYADSEWEDRLAEAPISRIAVVGNVLIAGRDTQDDMTFISGDAHKAEYYLEDNIATWANGKAMPLRQENYQLLKTKPVWPSGLTAIPADMVIESVTQNVGARPVDRDAIDQRIIREFQKRKGHIIDSQDEVGGYPEIEPVYRKLDIPEDNVETWLNELAVALLP